MNFRFSFRCLGVLSLCLIHPRMAAAGPKLSQAQVIRIANTAARRDHYYGDPKPNDLRDYGPPETHYEFIKDDHHVWTVFYQYRPRNKTLAVDHDIMVEVNDHTRAVKVRTGGP